MSVIRLIRRAYLALSWHRLDRFVPARVRRRTYETFVGGGGIVV